MIEPPRAGVLAVAVFVAGGPSSRAEPYIAMRAGLQCSACHVNHTGGGMRTSYGVDYGLEKLPAKVVPLLEGAQAARGVLSGFLSIGADFRGANASRFARSDDTNTFETEEGNLYADLKLLKHRLHLYVDERVAPGGAASRETFALIEDLPGHIYVKAGRFFPPYGLRLLDDGAFIRSVTGFNFQSPDDGVEVGWEPGRFNASLAITNGNGGTADDNTNKRLSLLASWTRPGFRLGGSLSSNRQEDVSSLLSGLMGGVKLGRRLVAFGEIDIGRDENQAAGQIARRLIGFAEADLLVAKGWNLKVAYDYSDPDTSQDGDEVDRVTAGAECFATQNLQFRALWRRTDRPPEAHGTLFEDDREVILEIHLFL